MASIRLDMGDIASTVYLCCAAVKAELGRTRRQYVNLFGLVPVLRVIDLGMALLEREVAHRFEQFEVLLLRVQIHCRVFSSNAMPTAIMIAAASILMPRSARESLSIRLARSAR